MNIPSITRSIFPKKTPDKTRVVVERINLLIVFLCFKDKLSSLDESLNFGLYSFFALKNKNKQEIAKQPARISIEINVTNSLFVLDFKIKIIPKGTKIILNIWKSISDFKMGKKLFDA